MVRPQRYFGYCLQGERHDENPVRAVDRAGVAQQHCARCFWRSPKGFARHCGPLTRGGSNLFVSERSPDGAQRNPGPPLTSLSWIALRSIRATIGCMSISGASVRFDEHTMWVELSDGRTLGVPLAWFPRLLRATPAERAQVELSRVGLHWEALDEDISIAGMLAGRGDIHMSRLDALAEKAIVAHRAGRSREL